MPARTLENPLTPALFRFLRDLAARNDTEWFAEHRARYHADVRDPCLRLIEALVKPVERVSPHFEAVARPVGGSLLLPHRDRRFAPDGPPYKGFAGIHLRHARARERKAAPGFYLHLEPRRVFLAAGVRRPDGATARQIRAAVETGTARVRRMLRAKVVQAEFELGGDRRKRPPPGLEPDHPLYDLLCRRDFLLVAGLTERGVCRPGFVSDAARLVRAAGPWMRFLCEALELEF